MRKRELRRTIRLIKGIDIPSRPTVLLEVVKAQNAFAPDLHRVSEIAKRDVVLASKILMAANTSWSKRKRQVSSVEQAVMLLGLSTIRKLMTEIFIGTSLIGKDAPLQKIRRHYMFSARTTAAVAGEISQISPAYKSGYLPAITPDEAYTLGLFHDVGLIVLMQRFADYHDFYGEQAVGESLVVAEQERYGTNHCLVGSLLCEGWRFPQVLCHVILTHHQPRRFIKPGKKAKARKALLLRAILNISDWVTGESTEAEWQLVRTEIQGFFNLEETELLSLKKRVQTAVPSEEKV